MWSHLVVINKVSVNFDTVRACTIVLKRMQNGKPPDMTKSYSDKCTVCMYVLFVNISRWKYQSKFKLNFKDPHENRGLRRRMARKGQMINKTEVTVPCSLIKDGRS